jgi:hypothetical protein
MIVVRHISKVGTAPQPDEPCYKYLATLDNEYIVKYCQELKLLPCKDYRLEKRP